MKTFSKPHALGLLSLLLSIVTFSKAHAQATVSIPFSVGTGGCNSSTVGLNYFNYNETTNTLTNNSTCTPWLRIGTTGTTSTANSFQSGSASISYNPKDKRTYYFWTAYAPSALTQGAPARTFVWSWPTGTCPGLNTTYLARIDTLRSFAYDILGVAFDKNGNGYIIEFGTTIPNTGYIRSIDFSTGLIGTQKQMSFTGGATIYENNVTGDVAMTPSGQMYFVANNKLFTPDYTSYSSAATSITTTFIDTVRTVGAGSLIGLTYAQGKLIAAYQNGTNVSTRTCSYTQLDPITVAGAAITATSIRSSYDYASITSGIGVSKNLVSVTSTGTAGRYTVVYDIYVKNYGNVDLNNVQVTDDLAAINGSTNVTGVSTAFVSNPAGLVLNATFNGSTIKTLLSGTVALPNYPTSSNTAVIRVTCTLSNITQGTVYNNSATGTGNGYNNVVVTDVSTNGTSPDLNNNDKADDVGENQATPLLIAVTAQSPPCTSLSSTIYAQDFGTGTTPVTTIPTSPNTGTTNYTGSTTQPLATDRYMITNNANNADNNRFISLTDHTGNTNGRMLVINADANNLIMYQGTVSSVCANQQYSLFFYAAFVGNANYQTVCNGLGGFQYPKIKMRIWNATRTLIISEISTASITGTSWAQYGMKWVMPTGFSSIVFELINDAPGGCGNDIAIDDIQFGLCSPLPTVVITNTPAGCIGSPASFSSSLTDGSVISGTPQYQWQMSTDNTTYANIGGASAATYSIGAVSNTDVSKYYRLITAATGNIGTVGCQYASPGILLAAKSPSTAPTTITKSKTAVCAGETFSLKASGATLGDGANYKWYTGSCGGILVGTGQVISVSPTVPTTYYVRVEGDCNTTTCISTAITFSCDIDKDKDGITDVAESGGIVPDADDDFDGVLNYRDADFCSLNAKGVCTNLDPDFDGIPNFLDLDSDNDGIPDVVEASGVDANGDGKIDNYTDTDGDGLAQSVDANPTGYISSGTGLGIPDLDGDGIPNFLDLDSDNDGIPDVVEVGGTDGNNDGMIDGFTDTDNDGFSQNVDGDANNDGIAENAANALLRTGADTNNDGRADSYPFKNMDADSKANPYDLDSDGDGISDVREAGFADADFNSKIDGAYGARGWSTTVSALSALVLPNSDVDPAGRYFPNYLDIDSDNDGIPDNIEGGLTNTYVLPSYVDSDGDGLDDSYDGFNGFGGSGFNPVNIDGDAWPDYIDQDADGDGVPDRIEGNDFNLNSKKDDLVTLLDTDADGDGLDDRFDADNATARGTSRYMGNGGSLNGPTTPGSRAMVQRSTLSALDRDWRDVGTVLSLNFTSIKATLSNDVVRVDWSVTDQKDISGYIVERSIDGSIFKSVKTISVTQAQNYTATDTVANLSATTLYYRIKAVAQAGKGGYSRISAVKKKLGDDFKLTVFPNPANQQLQMRMYAIITGQATFTISTIEGRPVARFSKYVTAGYNTLTYQELSRLPNGVYLLQMSLNGVMQNVHFAVQH